MGKDNPEQSEDRDQTHLTESTSRLAKDQGGKRSVSREARNEKLWIPLYQYVTKKAIYCEAFVPVKCTSNEGKTLDNSKDDKMYKSDRRGVASSGQNRYRRTDSINHNAGSGTQAATAAASSSN